MSLFMNELAAVLFLLCFFLLFVEAVDCVDKPDWGNGAGCLGLRLFV